MLYKQNAKNYQTLDVCTENWKEKKHKNEEIITNTLLAEFV